MAGTTPGQKLLGHFRIPIMGDHQCDGRCNDETTQIDQHQKGSCMCAFASKTPSQLMKLRHGVQCINGTMTRWTRLRSEEKKKINVNGFGHGGDQQVVSSFYCHAFDMVTSSSSSSLARWSRVLAEEDDGGLTLGCRNQAVSHAPDNPTRMLVTKTRPTLS